MKGIDITEILSQLSDETTTVVTINCDSQSALEMVASKTIRSKVLMSCQTLLSTWTE